MFFLGRTLRSGLAGAAGGIIQTPSCVRCVPDPAQWQEAEMWEMHKASGLAWPGGKIQEEM